MRFLYHVFRALLKPWSWQMAWRDSRARRTRLLLYLCSVAVGVGALVAIRSFGVDVGNAIGSQSKALLGADLVVRGDSEFADDVKAAMAEIKGESSRQRAFAGMAFFPKTSSPRLVQVRAGNGGFPWYGDVETEPADAYGRFKKFGGALVDQSLMLQFDAKPGDMVNVGDKQFIIVGALKSLPGENFVISQLAPRVVVPLKDVPKAGVAGFGSKVFYQRSFKYADGFDPTAVLKKLKGMQGRGIFVSTVADRSRRMAKRMDALFNFLALVAFVALLLGGVGVASSIHVYVRSKISSVAMLRCVGAESPSVFAIYLLQALMLGIIGGIAGVALGVVLQHILPRFLSAYVPVAIEVSLCLPAIGLGFGAGVVTTFIAAMLPLCRTRRISPMAAIRIDYAPPQGFDWIRGLLFGVALAGVAGFSINVAPRVWLGIGFTVGLFAAVVLLTIMARILMWGVRRLLPELLPYSARQGLNNLYRPGNQTCALILCIGTGVFLIMSLYLSYRQIVLQIQSTDGANNPNMILFDVKKEQLSGLRGLLDEMKLPVIEEAPVVTMRIRSVKGTSVDVLRKKKKGRHGRWMYSREYRSTYRRELGSSEGLVEGKFIGKTELGEAPIPITAEKDFARRLGVGLGDEIVFDVHGTEVKTCISGIRKVDWMRVQPNFLFVFPQGILENVPKMTVVVTHVPNAAAANRLQVRVVKQFPNVSLLDLAQIVNTISNLLDEMTFTIRFMALFSIATGILVLISSISNSRHQRSRENALLRTLGASGRQVMSIMATEYLMLGALAVNVGNALAIAGSYAMAHWVFKFTYRMDWIALAWSNFAVIGIVLVVGMLNTIGANRHPPLETLRAVGE